MSVSVDFSNALTLAQRAAIDDGANMFSQFENFVRRVEGIMARQAATNAALEKQNADLRAATLQNQTTSAARERALESRIALLEGQLNNTTAVANEALHKAKHHTHGYWSGYPYPPIPPATHRTEEPNF